MPLTHEFLAVMLGVRRAGVTVAIHGFERRGLVTTRRGQLTLVNRTGIEQIAGSFYGTPEAELKRLLRTNGLAFFSPAWFVRAMLPPVRRPAERSARIGCATPKKFQNWFASRGWQPRAHQLALVAQRKEGESVLLVAPTGGGKTLAGFLPTPDRPGRHSNLAARGWAASVPADAACTRSISRP